MSSSDFDITTLKVGDPVAYLDHHGRGWSSYATTRFATVAKFTPTQIVLANGRRFRRDTGSLVGGSPYSKLVSPQGPEAVAAKVLQEHNRVLKALEELRRTKEPTKPEAMAVWLGRISGVVADSMERLRQIGGAS